MSNTLRLDSTQYSRHEFDLMESSKSSQISIVNVNKNNINTGWELANREIPGEIADISAIQRVLEYNPNSVLLICRNNEIVGIWAMLMLSTIGLEELLIGKLKAINPDLHSLTPKDTAPEAIYFWAAVAPGLSAGGVLHISQFLRKSLYCQANCYSRPNTPAGMNFNIGMGFVPVNCGTPGLYRYVRLANRQENTINTGTVEMRQNNA